MYREIYLIFLCKLYCYKTESFISKQKIDFDQLSLKVDVAIIIVRLILMLRLAFRCWGVTVLAVVNKYLYINISKND